MSLLRLDKISSLDGSVVIDVKNLLTVESEIKTLKVDNISSTDGEFTAEVKDLVVKQDGLVSSDIIKTEFPSARTLTADMSDEVTSKDICLALIMEIVALHLTACLKTMLTQKAFKYSFLQEHTN